MHPICKKNTNLKNVTELVDLLLFTDASLKLISSLV